ncbi:hypothetical protein IGI01_24915 [Bacillus thuringiensis]|nr:hypothetical protein [Bacillus thuringiensis]
MNQTNETNQHEEKKDSKRKELISAKAVFEKYGPQPEYNKGNFNDGVRFIRTPADLKHYMFMSDYGVKESTLWLYLVIVDRYNDLYGYAYPTQSQLAFEMGRKPNAIKQNLRVLENVGLLKTESRGKGFANVYKPLVPMKLERMLKLFPVAKKRYEKLRDDLKIYDKTNLDRMPEHMQQRRETSLKEIQNLKGDN